MAYPTVSAPYGLVPVNLIGGQVYAGAVREIPIASGYAANVFNGDVVKMVAAGTIEKDTGTATATPIGVFMGCSFTDADRGYVNSNYWPTGQVAADAVAYVADDPSLCMKVALVSGTTVIAPYTRAELVGANAPLVQNAGSTANGRSKVAIDGSGATTTKSLPMRIIDLVEETTDSNGEYTECIVIWNTSYFDTDVMVGGHQYLNPTALA